MNDDPFNEHIKPMSPSDVLVQANRNAHKELQHLHRALQVPSRFLRTK